MNVGTRIAVARRRLKKMSQKRLAEIIGVTEQAISNWERGEDAPGITRLPQLRQALRVTYAWLHEGGDTPPPDPESPEVIMDDLAAEASAARSSVAKAILGLRKRSGT